MATTQHVTGTRSLEDTISRPQVALVAVVTILGALAYEAFLFWHHPYERSEVVPYDKMLDVRSGWWTSHYVGGTLMALGFVGLGLALAVLVRSGKGSVWVTVGAALCVLGALPVAAGLASEGTAYYLVTDQRGVDGADGARLLHFAMTDGSDRIALGTILGLALVSLGSIVGGIGLLLSRSAPLWVPVALIVGTIIMMAAPHAIDWWASLPRSVAAVAIAWLAWQAARGTPDVRQGR